MNWAGTIFYLIGMVLTAADVYPLNLVFGALGGLAWFVVGVIREDLALLVVELAAAVIYCGGLVHWAFSFWGIV